MSDLFSPLFAKRRRAFVTGASRGIGEAIARRLAKHGCEIICPTRSEMDLADAGSVEKYFERTKLEIDILINNAGINFPRPVDDLSLSNWNDTIQVNLTAPFLLSRHFAKGMRARKWGRIVNISSVFSLVSKEGRSVYSATKSALNGFTRTCAIEFGRDGVLVNAVCPGYIDTALTRQNNSEADIKSICGQIALGRMAQPDEIADLVVFLSSDMNSYLTGQCVVADGGFSIR